MENQSSKSNFIKQVRKSVDISIQEAVSYFNLYGSDITLAINQIKIDYINKLRKEADINEEIAIEVLEKYRFNYELSISFFRQSRIQAIDRILLDSKKTDKEKLKEFYNVYRVDSMYYDIQPVDSLKEALLLLSLELGHTIALGEEEFIRIQKATKYIDDNYYVDYFQKLSFKDRLLMLRNYGTYPTEVLDRLLRIIESKKELFYE